MWVIVVFWCATISFPNHEPTWPALDVMREIVPQGATTTPRKLASMTAEPVTPNNTFVDYSLKCMDAESSVTGPLAAAATSDCTEF